MLRNSLIFPLLSEPAAMKRGGLTVNYLEKTDNFRSTSEEIRAELHKMKADKLVISKSGGIWTLTDNGLAAWMSEKVSPKACAKKVVASVPSGGKITNNAPILEKTVSVTDLVTPSTPPVGQLQDFTELLAELATLQDVNQLKAKVALISELYKWLHPEIGDLFAEIIDELVKHQDIARMARKCLLGVARS